MKALIFAIGLLMAFPAMADNSSDHKCAQDLLAQFEALKIEYIDTDKYPEHEIRKMTLNFESVFRDKDRIPQMWSDKRGDIYVNYGVCDISKYKRYMQLRSMFEGQLPRMKSKR